MRHYVKSLSLIFFSLLMVTGQVFAHPGHDHSHWSASLIHVLWLAAPLALLAAYALFRKTRAPEPKAQKKDTMS